jgi:hypothetical protein
MTNHPIVFLLLFFVSFFYGVSAQDPTPEVVTDRPDQTESSRVVPTGTVQVETGALAEFDKTTFTESRDITFNTTLVRYGLAKNFELRPGIDFLEYRSGVIDSPLNVTLSGTGPLYSGFKVQIAEEQGILPEVALLGGVELSFLASDPFSTSNPAGSIRFAFSHTLTDRFSLGYNLGGGWDGESSD